MDHMDNIPSGPITAFRDQIDQFFARYIDAFARSDAEALSEMWDPVGFFPSPSTSPCLGMRFATTAYAFRSDASERHGAIRHPCRAPSRLGSRIKAGLAIERAF